MPDETKKGITPSEFAAKIKAKYPAYADVDDNVLVEKILSKYPEYKDQVDFSLKKKDETESSQDFNKESADIYKDTFAPKTETQDVSTREDDPSYVAPEVEEVAPVDDAEPKTLYQQLKAGELPSYNRDDADKYGEYLKSIELSEDQEAKIQEEVKIDAGKTKDLEKQLRSEYKRKLQINFIEELSDESRESLQEYIAVKTGKISGDNLNLLSENKFIENKFNQSLEEIGTWKEVYDKRIAAGEDLTKEEYASWELATNDYNKLVENYTTNLRIIESNTNDLADSESELDLFKRNYGGAMNFINKLDYAAEEAVINVEEFATDFLKVSDFNYYGTFDNFISERQDVRDAQRDQLEAKRKLLQPDQRFEDIDNLYDFGQWSSEMVATQIPNIVTLSALGYGGLVVMGASAGGARSSEMKEKVKSGEADFTDREILIAGSFDAAAEIVGETFTLGLLKGGGRIIRSAITGGAKKQVTGGISQYVMGAAGEGASEGLTTLMQNSNSIWYLEDKDVHITDGLIEAIAGGVFLGTAMSVAPAAAGDIIRTFRSKKNNKTISENNTEMMLLGKSIQALPADSKLREPLIDRIKELVKENKGIIKGDIKSIEGKSVSDLESIVKVDKDIRTLNDQKEAFATADDIDLNAKASMVKSLDKKIDKLVDKKEDLINSSGIEIAEKSDALMASNRREENLVNYHKKGLDEAKREGSEFGIEYHTEELAKSQKQRLEDSISDYELYVKEAAEDFKNDPTEENKKSLEYNKQMLEDWKKDLENYKSGESVKEELKSEAESRLKAKEADKARAKLKDVELAMTQKYGEDYKESDLTPEDFQALEQARLDTEDVQSVKGVEKSDVYKVEDIEETTDAKLFVEKQTEAISKRTEDKLQVTVLSEKDAQKIIDDGGKLFITKDGTAGAYVKADGYMGGLFKDPTSTKKQAAKALQEVRIKAGGKFFDAFGTHLEDIYIKNGFEPVARMTFNEEYAPEGWKDTNLKSKPDNVFFVYNPDGNYKKGDGARIEDYDKAYDLASNYNKGVTKKQDTKAEAKKEEGKKAAKPSDVLTEEQKNRLREEHKMTEEDIDNLSQEDVQWIFGDEIASKNLKDKLKKIKEAEAKKEVKPTKDDKAKKQTTKDRESIKQESKKATEKPKAGAKDGATKQVAREGDKGVAEKSVNSQLEGKIKELERIEELEKQLIHKQAKMALGTLKKLFPDVQVKTRSGKDYAETVPDDFKDSAGLYDPNTKTIYINLDAANQNTVGHEVFHAILIETLRGEVGSERVQVEAKRLTEDMVNSLLDALPNDSKAYNDILQLRGLARTLYDGDIVNEEVLSELVGILSANYEHMDVSAKTKVRLWINKLAKALGLGVVFKKDAKDKEVVDFLNNLSEKISTGKALSRIDTEVISGSIDGKAKPVVQADIDVRLSKYLDELKIEKLPTNPNSIVKENVSISTIAGQIASSTLSDKLMTGKIGKFKMLGGLGYPRVTGRVWAAGDEAHANKIVNESKVSKDGYRYLIPAILSDTAHMSNRNMAHIAVNLLREAVANKEVRREELLNNVIKSFDKVQTKKHLDEVKKLLGSKPTIKKILDVTESFILGDKMTFERRKDVLKTLIGNQVKKGARYPSVGNYDDLAKKLAGKTSKELGTHQLNTVIRTKGDLKTVKTPVNDEFYHTSYPYHVESSENVEVLYLDGVYDLIDVIPEFETNKGKKYKTSEEVQGRPEGRTEKYARTNLARTHGLSSYSAPIVDPIAKRQQRAGFTLPNKVKTKKDSKGRYIQKFKGGQIVIENYEKGQWEGYIEISTGLSKYPDMLTGKRVEMFEPIDEAENFYAGTKRDIISDIENFISYYKNRPQSESIDTRQQKAGFDKWFEGSKVVNKDGSPKVVYHGSQKGDFTSFNAFPFFTEEKGEANNYASTYVKDEYGASNERLDGSKVFEVFLNIKNPVGDGTDVWVSPLEANLLGKRLQNFDVEGGSYLKEKYKKLLKKIDKWKSEGYDGIKTRSDSGYTYSDGAEKSYPTHWIPFHSNQIKSIDAKTFSTESIDIREQKMKNIPTSVQKKALKAFADELKKTKNNTKAINAAVEATEGFNVTKKEMVDFIKEVAPDAFRKFHNLYSLSKDMNGDEKDAWSSALKAAGEVVDEGGSVERAANAGVESIRNSDWWSNLPQEDKFITLETFRDLTRQSLEEELSKEEAEIKARNEVITSKMTEPSSMRGFYDSVRTVLQDSMFRVKKMNKLLEKYGFQVTDDLNVYLQETLQKGKAVHKILDIKNKILNVNNPNSFINKMKELGVKYNDLGRFMIARHSIERNNKALEDLRKMQELLLDESDDNKANRSELFSNLKKALNEKTNEKVLEEIEYRINGLENGTYAGYGMDSKSAVKLLQDRIDDKSFDDFTYLADLFKDEVSDRALEMEYDAGMITKESYENLISAYDYYTPLLVEDDSTPITSAKRIGDAYSGILHIKGSKNEKLRKNPIESGIVKFNSTALNTERNKTAQSLYNMIEKNMSQSELFDIVNEAEFISLSAGNKKLIDKTIRVKVDGVNYFIIVNDSNLAKTLKSVVNDSDLSVILKPFNSFNNWLRAVLTQYNPAFMMPNYVRDFQQVYFNLPKEVKDKVKIVKFSKLSAKSISGIKNYKTNFAKGKNPTTKEGRAYKELLAYGGVSRWGVETDPKNISKKISKSFDIFEDLDTKKYFNDLLKGLDNLTLKKLDELGEYAEHANRLTVYMASREAGQTKDRSAYLAKESSINFDRKGTMGSILNSLFVFSNAGIQGTTRMLHTWKTNPKSAAKTSGTIAAMSAVSVLAIYAMGMGDAYDDESEWDKLHNIYLPIPVDEGEELIKIPTPYGLNMIPYMGQKVASVAYTGDLDKMDEISESLVSVGEEILNPLGGSFVPSAFRPLVDIQQNKDFRDLPIFYENVFSGQDHIHSEKGKDKTGEAFKSFAKFMNKATGGTKNTRGLVDWHPETYRHLIEGYGGGVYKMLKNTIETAGGEEDAQLPIVRRFYSSPRENVGTMKFYELYKESGAVIFDKKDFTELRKLYRRAMDESEIEESKLTQMLVQVYQQQIKKKRAEAVNKTVDEMLGVPLIREKKKERLKRKRESK